MTTRTYVVLGIVLAIGLVPTAATSQPLGTFRWQQVPYCNVLVVNLVQNGAVYNVDGVDDQCGAGTAAAVVGMAFPNPNGTIGLGFTVVTTPGGTALHIDATVGLPSGSGTWRDSSGASGAFTLISGAAAPGSPRPVPRATFPGGLSAAGTTITNVGAPASASDAANKSYVDGATAVVRSALIGQKVWRLRLTSSGLKQTTGPFTSSRLSAGRYDVRINVTGLGIAATAGFPMAVVDPGGNTPTFGGVCGLGATSSAGFLTELRVIACTYNSAGTAADAPTGILVAIPDADSGSPVPPLGHGQPPAEGTCVSEGDTTTCFTTPPR